MTPTSYLQLLDCFKTLLRRQQQGVTAQWRRYEIGLEKLAGTEEQVRPPAEAANSACNSSRLALYLPGAVPAWKSCKSAPCLLAGGTSYVLPCDAGAPYVLPCDAGARQVTVMRAELEQKQPVLIASGKETAELIALVEAQTAEADKVKTLVQVRPVCTALYRAPELQTSEQVLRCGYIHLMRAPVGGGGQGQGGGRQGRDHQARVRERPRQGHARLQRSH